MRITTKSVQRPNPKWRTTLQLQSALLDPLSYIGSHYPDVCKCQSGISNPRSGLRPERRFAPLARGQMRFCLLICVFPNRPCQLPCGRKPDRSEKTHGFGRVLTNSLHQSGTLGSSNIENILTENRTRNLRGKRRVL